MRLSFYRQRSLPVPRRIENFLALAISSLSTERDNY